MKTWDKEWLKSYIIDNKDNLENLFNLIKDCKEIVLDTETTSLDIMKAELVGVSIYINDDKIYYINRLHEWKRVLDIDLKEFLIKIFNLDILIVWHNIKYDLEIIDLYLKKSILDLESESNWWQISLWL